MPQLIIKWSLQEHRFTINTSQVSIGRSDTNLLQIKDAKISRYHCQIVHTPLGYLLSDSGSSNGIFINEQRTERKILQNNDIIKIGDIAIVFSAGNSSVFPAQSEMTQKKLEPLVITNPNPSTKPVLSENATVIITNINKNITTLSNNLSPSPQPINALDSKRKPLTIPSPPINQIKKKESSISSRITKVNTTSSTAKYSGIDKKIIVSQPTSTKTTTTISRSQTPTPASNKITTPTPSKKLSTLIKRKSTTSIGKLMPQKIQEYDFQEMETKPQPNKNKKYYILGGVAVAIILLIVALIKHYNSVEKETEEERKQNQFLTDAKNLYENKHYADALKKYREFLNEFANSKYLDKAKENIKKIESQIAKEKEGKTKLAELISKKKDCPVNKYPELLKEFEDFVKEHNASSFVSQAKSEIESMRRVAESEESERESNRVKEIEAEANALYEKGDYDTAINKLQEFLDKNPSLNNRLKNTIKNDIKNIKKEKEQNSEKK
jgi:pSer/pThr/pTyr-binding forkhead associated (FHA) protein